VTPAGHYDRAIEPASPLNQDGPLGRFADHLLGVELPDLPVERRAQTTLFVCRRAGELPSPLRIGVALLAVAVGAAEPVAGLDRITQFVRVTRFPFIGELARMVRSLGFTYIWETWPDTSPTGGSTHAPTGDVPARGVVEAAQP